LDISAIIMNTERFDNKEFTSNKVGVEIQSFPQHILDDNYDELIKIWKEKLEGFNEVISLHGSSFDLNPGSTDKRILEVTKYRYLQSIDIAKKLSAKYVIFHSQVNPLLTVKRIRALKLDNQIKFWNSLFKHEIPSDVCVLIENEYDESYEDILKICDSVNSSNIGVCLDIGHTLAYSKTSLEDWIANLGNRIKYIHLHWNNGESDDHNKPTNSQIDLLRELLVKYEICPTITLEYYSENIYEEARRVKNILDY